MSDSYETKSTGTLRATTSNNTGRYERTGLAELDNVHIPAACFIRSRPESANLPQHWSSQVHPEGQIYFCRQGAPRVVTEAYLHRPETLGKVTRWVQKIEEMLADQHFRMTEQVELFIKIEEDDCAYYFVDHVTHTEFWLEELNTYDLGLPPVVSLQQFSIISEELYWSHVEHFPMHFGGVSTESLDSLLCVLTHAICDQMTSKVSTFPYSKQECEGFVSLLKNSRGHATDGNITCVVGRIWSLVFRNRYLTQYGQENSRLSRDQSVLYAPETKHQWVSTLANRVSFNISERYLAQLDDVFVDHLVYSEQWKNLIAGCLKDWRASLHGAFFGLMLHVFLLSLQSCPTLAVTSALLFGASLLGSTLLMHRYGPLEGISATQAMEYLESIQSPTFKFRFVALMFALPDALRLWGMLVFFANGICMTHAYLGTAFAAGISIAALLVIFMFQWTTSERFNNALANLRSFRSQDDTYTSLV
ncbi:hypothetical protein FB45DRAFT_474018 [Roridomyces roridus]|uniref:Uncharacterized protein n=1 Tax=Roridomyces roridus TaxID=1738132 RepID=A0AAD7BZ56_9AGAR|nr:hypothetical protein FB45DRAFT_474018 [Roridomyces roridus]